VEEDQLPMTNVFIKCLQSLTSFECSTGTCKFKTACNQIICH